MAKEYKAPKSLKDITPFNQGFNSTLVRQAGLTSKYGTGYEGYGEVDIDKMMDPAKKVLSDSMKKKEKKDKKKKNNKKNGSGDGGGDGRDVTNIETQNIYNNGSDGTGDADETGKTDKVGSETINGDPVEKTGCDKECCDERKAEGEDVTWSTANSDEGECVESITEKETGHPQCIGGTWNRDTNQCECPKGTTYDEETFTCVEDTEVSTSDGDPAEEADTPPVETDTPPDEVAKKIVGCMDENANNFDSTATEACVQCCDYSAASVNTTADVSQYSKETLGKDNYKKLVKENSSVFGGSRQGGGNISEHEDNNDYRSVQRGGGDVTNEFEYIWGKDRLEGRSLTGSDSQGKEFNFGYTEDDDGMITFNAFKKEHKKNKKRVFSQNRKSFLGTGKSGDLTKIPGWKKDGKYNAADFNKFVKGYRTTLYSAQQKLAKINAGGKDCWNNPKSCNLAFDEGELAVLQMDGRGFTTYIAHEYGKKEEEVVASAKGSPDKYRSPMKHPAEDPVLRDGSKVTHEHGENNKIIYIGQDGKPISEEILKSLAGGGINQKPFSFKSPFAKRDRSHLNVRKKWTPQSQPTSETGPMMYRSPLHQEIDPNQDPTVQSPEEMAGIEGQEMQQPQGETIWDKIQMYGDGVKTQVDKFVSNASFNPGVDKPVKAIQNQEWIGRITEWLKEKKTQLVQAKKSKDKKLEQEINQHVQALIGDVSTFAGKFESWRSRNGGDQTPGNKGGNMTSEGSSKDKRFEADLAFVGDPNTSMDISEEGKIGIKSYGLDDLKWVDDLDNDVFMKDFMGYQQMLEMSAQLQEDAESGRPLNKNIIGGQADVLLANKDSLLSWAHDPLYGQAWIQDFAQGNPGENLDWAMPESDQFDKDRLEDEVHGWLTDKLTQAYTKYAPKDKKDAEGIKEDTMASIDQGGYSKNTPMAYKQNLTTAQQLIAKYGQ